MGLSSSKPRHQGRHIRLDLPPPPPGFAPDHALRWRAVCALPHPGAHLEALRGALPVGRDALGLPLFLARVATPSGVWLGHVGPSVRFMRGAHVVTGVVAARSAVVCPYYEVLLGPADGYSLTWEAWAPEGGPPPPGSVLAGRTAEGQPLLAGVGSLSVSAAAAAASRSAAGAEGLMAVRVPGLASGGACLVHGSQDAAVALPVVRVAVVRRRAPLSAGALAYDPAPSEEGGWAGEAAPSADAATGGGDSGGPQGVPLPGTPIPLDACCAAPLGVDIAVDDRVGALRVLANDATRQWGWHWAPRPLSRASVRDLVSPGGLVWDCGPANEQGALSCGRWRGAGFARAFPGRPTEAWSVEWARGWPNGVRSAYRGMHALRAYGPGQPAMAQRVRHAATMNRARRSALLGRGAAAAAAAAAGVHDSAAVSALEAHMEWGLGEDEGWPMGMRGRRRVTMLPSSTDVDDTRLGSSDYTEPWQPPFDPPSSSGGGSTGTTGTDGGTGWDWSTRGDSWGDSSGGTSSGWGDSSGGSSSGWGDSGGGSSSSWGDSGGGSSSW